MEREVLYDRINSRVDQMMDEGLLDEVKLLYDENVRNCQSVQAIGYKELYAHLEGRASLEEAVETLKRNSRRYAKRQLTWFRNQMDVAWFDMTPLSISSRKTGNFHLHSRKARTLIETIWYRETRRTRNMKSINIQDQF